jgi:hypothetical protein
LSLRMTSWINGSFSKVAKVSVPSVIVHIVCHLSPLSAKAM